MEIIVDDMETKSRSDIKLVDLDITVLALTKLQKAGINSLADIATYTESDLAMLLNSRRAFLSVVEVMKKYSVRFKPLF